MKKKTLGLLKVHKRLGLIVDVTADGGRRLTLSCNGIRYAKYAIILDVILPNLDGYGVLDRLR